MLVTKITLQIKRNSLLCIYNERQIWRGNKEERSNSQSFSFFCLSAQFSLKSPITMGCYQWFTSKTIRTASVWLTAKKQRRPDGEVPMRKLFWNHCNLSLSLYASSARPNKILYIKIDAERAQSSIHKVSLIGTKPLVIVIIRSSPTKPCALPTKECGPTSNFRWLFTRVSKISISPI